MPNPFIKEAVLAFGKEAAHAFIKEALSPEFVARAVSGAGVDRMRFAVKKNLGGLADLVPKADKKLLFSKKQRNISYDEIMEAAGKGTSAERMARLKELRHRRPTQRGAYGELRAAGYKPSIKTPKPGTPKPAAAPTPKPAGTAKPKARSKPKQSGGSGVPPWVPYAAGAGVVGAGALALSKNNDSNK